MLRLQEDMLARPSMPMVVQMLEGVIQIPRPPPLPMQFALNTQFARILDLNTQSAIDFSGIQILSEPNSTVASQTFGAPRWPSLRIDDLQCTNATILVKTEVQMQRNQVQILPRDVPPCRRPTWIASLLMHETVWSSSCGHCHVKSMFVAQMLFLYSDNGRCCCNDGRIWQPSFFYVETSISFLTEYELVREFLEIKDVAMLSISTSLEVPASSGRELWCPSYAHGFSSAVAWHHKLTP